eukprot:903873_1
MSCLDKKFDLFLCHSMSTFYFVIFIIYCACCISNAVSTVSFTSYATSELPVPLHKHISVLYNHEIHIIAGYLDFDGTSSNYTYAIPLTSPSPSYTSTPSIAFPSILYSSHCYAVFNDKIHFIMGGVGTSIVELYWFQYNLITKSFEDTATYNSSITLDNQFNTYVQHPATCVVYDTVQYMHVLLPPNVLSGLLESSQSQSTCIDADRIKSIRYDTIGGDWKCMRHPQMRFTRRGVSCGLATNHYDVYIFGGSIDGYDTNIIEQWNMITNYVQVIGRMQYKRSFFPVLVTSANYFVIGNTLQDDTIEIWDANDNVMLDPSQGDRNWIANSKRNAYGMFIYNDQLMMNGGYDENNTISNEIIYVSMGDIFDIPSNISQDASFYSCITRYETASTSPLNIDSYLYADSHQFVFALNQQMTPNSENTPSRFESDAKIVINDETYYISNSSIASDYDTSIYEQTIGIIRYPKTYVVNLNPSVELLWFSWSTNNNVVDGMPLFRFGIGDKMDENEMLFSNDDAMFVFEDMTPIAISSTSVTPWRFYHNLCDLQIETSSVISNASVGDLIPIQLSLINATSLNTVLSVTSDDISGVQYDLVFGENEICVNELCNDSALPYYLEIEGFMSYDVDNNEYHVYFEADNDNLMVNGDDHNHTVIIHRHVMNVEIVIAVDGAIYPGSLIRIYPMYNHIHPSQPNATISIHFDDDLSFNGTGNMFIDFYANTCVIEYDTTYYASKTMQIGCYDEFITIPWTMHQKPITHNTYTLQVTSSDVYLIGETVFTLSRQIQEVSLNISNSLYLGEVIHFNPYILDKNVVQNSSSIKVYSQQHFISYTVYMSYDANTNAIVCHIETAITKSIQSCDHGIPFQTADLTLITNTIQLLLETNDTILDEYNISIFIEQCPMGKGVIGSNYNLSSYLCTDCPVNEVSIWSNSECFECNDLSGVACFGSSTLIVSFNHWVAVNQPDNEYTFDLFDDQNDAALISTFCPSGFCCNDLDGCDFMETNLCATNRDPTTPLCGSCVEGYSEVFGSTSCKKCDNNNWFYAVIPFIISIFVVLLLIILDPPPNKSKDNEKEIDYGIYLAKDDLKALQICVLRPCVYFFQAISFITIQNGLYFYLTPLIKILSFDFLIESDSDDGGVCFLPNMNSMDKILWSLFFPFCMCLALVVIKLFHLLLKHVCHQPIARINFGWNVVWSVLLIFIGNAVSTMMKLLACSKVGSLFVHFHAGYLECYGSYFYISALVMMTLIVFWIVVWWLLFKMPSAKRDSRSSYLRALTKPYKLDLWWWEVLLLTRRILIAFFATFQYIANEYIQYILIVLLIVYLMLHVHFQPFTYQRVNSMEMLCISMLIICLLSINTFQLDRNMYYDTVSSIMSVVVLAPLVLFILYIVMSVKHVSEVTSMLSGALDIDKDNELSKKVNKMKHRLTASQQKPFDTWDQMNREKEEEQQEKQIAVELHKRQDVNDSNGGGKADTMVGRIDQNTVYITHDGHCSESISDVILEHVDEAVSKKKKKGGRSKGKKKGGKHVDGSDGEKGRKSKGKKKKGTKKKKKNMNTSKSST